MRHPSRIRPAAGIVLFAGLSAVASGVRPGDAVASPTPAEPSQAQAAPAAAPYFYGAGAQGLGYYYVPQAPQPAAVRAPSQSAARPRASTVGPGARNWATGNRVPLHRPWLRSRS